MYGWNGRLLRVNLTDGDVRHEKIGQDRLDEGIGGMGIATGYLCNEIREKVDPVSADNKIVLFTGPLAGTPIVSSGRFCLVTASPLTNYFLQSHCGGHFGPELKYAGLDGIIVEGASEDPVYLSIDDDQVDIRPANHIWGRGVKSATRFLERENDPESKSIAIGPAGERMAPISNVKCDVYRSLGRGGCGAVFGSKNLKAVVVRGTGGVEVKDPDYLRDHILFAKEKAKDVSRAFIQYGTTTAGILVNRAGGLPTRNFHLGRFDNTEDISGLALKKTIWKGRRSCYSCPIGCSQYSVIGGIRTEGPEYETIFALGSNVLNPSAEALVEMNERCNDMGIDTISAGVTISWLMEASEKGLIGGDYKWGDPAEIVELIRKTANGEGIGEEIARGAKRLSEQYGGEEFAIHVKGMELPGYDPRVSQGTALAYAVSNIGGSHLRAPLYVKELFQKTVAANTMEGKVPLLVDIEDVSALMDCLIICRFASRSLIEENFNGGSEIIGAVTGVSYPPEGLRASIRKVWTMQRLFNIRQGMMHWEDSLPDRFFTEDLEGHPALDKAAFDARVQEYYAMRGCDPKGIPTDATLRSMGLL